jgi:hypothetical protein
VYKIELVTNNNTKILGHKESEINAEEYAKTKARELKSFLRNEIWGIKISVI